MELLSDLKSAAMEAAKQDYDQVDWLVNAITLLMAEVCQVAKIEFLRKTYGADASEV